MKRSVTVELDGKTKELRYDFQAMTRYEDMVGTGFEQSLANLGYKTILAMYVAGLSHKDKGITPQRVAKLLDKETKNGKTQEDLIAPALEAIYRGGYLNEKMYKAFKEALLDEEDDDYDEDYDEDDDDEEEAKNE